MEAEYDKIARQFKKSRELPFRTDVEEFTVFEMLGDPAGLSVLDLACGEGHYARQLRRKGAAKVVGVDLSEAMISLAREADANEPLGIEYRQGAVEDLGVIGQFDVVTAVYLLHYAPSRTALDAMLVEIAANLKPGGRLIAVISNFAPGSAIDIAKYGWSLASPVPSEEGKPYRLCLLSGPDAFEIENYLYSRHTYEEGLARAGFGTARWHAPQVSDEGLRRKGAEYWREFLEHQPIIGLEAEKMREYPRPNPVVGHQSEG